MPGHFLTIFLFLSALLGTGLAPLAAAGGPGPVRFATLNAAMGLAAEGELALRLQSGFDPGLQSLAEILQRVRPDVVLLTEMDYQADTDAAGLLQRNYLSVSQAGLEPIDFPHHYSAPVNTGVDSGLDLDGSGRTGDPGDAWGFGRFPGQYGMLLLSRYPLELERIRSFQRFRWRDMPDALQPADELGHPFYPPETWERIRLSSKSHWDVPLRIGTTRVHLLASHPTPPVFDGPEDRNGRRNHDEIRLWADYLRPGGGDYLVDDAGAAGGLAADTLFVIAGDLNADPHDGDSTRQAIRQLLAHERVNAACVPRSRGGVAASREQGRVNLEHRGDPAADTADMGDTSAGNLRIDYVLPSLGLEVVDCGVFWPAAGEPGEAAAAFSDHRLVWVDLRLPQPEAATP
jgi:endonuclease/exonuclease/phosphatase family metal-dependent hydrolase